MSKAPTRPLRPRIIRRVAPLAVFGMAIGICGGGWLGLCLAVVGLIALLICCFESDGEFRLFGPFLKSELIRSGRGSLRNLWRPIYTLITFALLLIVYYLSIPEVLETSVVINSSDTVEIQAANERFFFTYAFFLSLYTVILTANVFSSFVAEERESKRWDILRVTHLTSREILLGKALGRLPQVLDPVMTTIPVIAISTLIGGVSPYMVLLLTINIISIVILIGGMTMFYSTFSTTPAQARNVVFGLAGIYVLVSFLTMLFNFAPEFLALPRPYISFPFEIGDVLGWFQSGNLIVLYERSLSMNLGLEEQISYVVQRFAAFSVLFGTIFTLVAIARMRTATSWYEADRLKEQSQQSSATISTVKYQNDDNQQKTKNNISNQNSTRFQRPEVTDDSITWWELYHQPSNVKGRLPSKQEMVSEIVRKSVYVLTVFLAFRLFIIGMPNSYITSMIHDFFHGFLFVFSFVICLILFISGLLQGARTIARERAGDTLDGILTTALSTDEIIYQKWKGCLLNVSSTWKLAIIVFVPATLTGFLHPFSGLLYLCCLMVFHASAIAIGLSFSVNASQPAIAVRNMLLVIVPIAGIGMMCNSVFLPMQSATFWFDIFTRNQVNFFGIMDIISALISLLFWTSYGFFAWKYTQSAFRKVKLQ